MNPTEAVVFRNPCGHSRHEIPGLVSLDHLLGGFTEVMVVHHTGPISFFLFPFSNPPSPIVFKGDHRIAPGGVERWIHNADSQSGATDCGTLHFKNEQIKDVLVARGAVRTEVEGMYFGGIDE